MWKRCCAGAVAALFALSCGGAPTPLPPGMGGSIIVAAAGDIACDPDSDANYFGGAGGNGVCQMKAVSDLVVATNPDAVLTLGDTQYENGLFTKFTRSYEPTWGRFRAITHPAAGNHDSTAGYWEYFNGIGAANGPAGPTNLGYYSFNLGAWHFIALNSNCSSVGGCNASSPQVQWLRSDLAASQTTPCTIAYWHHPRFSSGDHAKERLAPNPNRAYVDDTYLPIWDALYQANVDVALSGHDHNYERFAPLNANGDEDNARGIRSFVVGTGGKDLRPFPSTVPRPAVSLVRDRTTYGFLKLTLAATSYTWQFVSAAGGSFTDSGSGNCH